jgi:hypothetical protein
MVELRDSLKAFLELASFQELSTEVCREINSSLFPNYPPVMFESLVKRVAAANVSTDQLKATLVSNQLQFVAYVKRVFFATNFERIEEEFPPGYNPSDDDFSKLKKVLGVSKDFLLRYLVDFHIISEKPDFLERYLIATGTPQAKKQAEKMKLLFQSA